MDQTFIGYPEGVSGYMCHNPKLGKILASHDILFIEDDFTLNSSLWSSQNFDDFKEPADNPNAVVNRSFSAI